jgi:hypothetical protein
MAVASLTACGGGGGGGGGSIVEVPFTSFSAVAPRQTVVMTGISETIGGTTDVSGTQVLSLDPSTVLDSASSTARLTYDVSGNISQVNIRTPQSSFSVSPIDCTSPPLCVGANATSEIVAVNPELAPPFFGGWNYQTFGVWLQQTGPSSFRAGGISVGAVTPAMPTTGTANFSGLASGFFVSGASAFATASTMTADVDFQLRSINFATQNTTTVSFAGGPSTSAPGLDFNGTVIYNPGSNQFRVPVTTTACCFNMSGDVNGRFYGPAAQEIGGVYSLTDGGSNRMLGAFGGRRP